MRAIPEVLPKDELNANLLKSVHPADYLNPTPADRYNLVIVGAGTAGLVTAAVAAGLGARVALVERDLMGGDCLNVGCVPSKTLIRSARTIGEIRDAPDLGVRVPAAPQVDFTTVMARVRRVRAQIAPHDSVERYCKELGVDVFLGEGRFTGADRVEVDGAMLCFARAVIATGARAVAPPIEGLAETGYLTNETVFSLTERPARLAVIGAGPIGCELAQAFQRLGSNVTLLELAPQILIREDPDAARIVERSLVRDGVRIELDISIDRVEKTDAGGVRLHYHKKNKEGEPASTLDVDQILIGAGRKPNVDGLGLESAGVRYEAVRGVEVDDYLRTSNSRIYAAGDVCMAAKFTHAADAAAKIVVQNALFFGRKRLSKLILPWCTYTSPEVAHVGLYERDALQAGIAIDTFTLPLERNDRSITDADTEGFVKVHVRKGSDRILGATIVAGHAGEMISQVTTAMAGGVGLGGLVNVIYPYPTQSEALKAVAGAYARTRLTPWVARLFAAFLRMRR